MMRSRPRKPESPLRLLPTPCRRVANADHPPVAVARRARGSLAAAEPPLRGRRRSAPVGVSFLVDGRSTRQPRERLTQPSGERNRGRRLDGGGVLRQCGPRTSPGTRRAPDPDSGCLVQLREFGWIGCTPVLGRRALRRRPRLQRRMGRLDGSPPFLETASGDTSTGRSVGVKASAQPPPAVRMPTRSIDDPSAPR